MSELRTPTVALAAEVLMADGRTLRGRVFVPSAASRHTGPTRPGEWMNDGVRFFPFLPDPVTPGEGSAPVILNKEQVLVVSLPATDDTLLSGFVPPGAHERHVILECGGRRLEGTILIDMPEEHCRVLDYLNDPAPFLMLRDAEHHHLVPKERITRVMETRED
jgi:hypothetical protein